MPGTARILEFFEVEPAVVADIERAVGTDRSAVRAAADGADHLFAAAPAAGDAPAGEFDDDDRPVRHRHRPPGKGEALRDNQLGKEACRERVCMYVKISVDTVSLNKKSRQETKRKKDTKTNKT